MLLFNKMKNGEEKHKDPNACEVTSHYITSYCVKKKKIFYISEFSSPSISFLKISIRYFHFTLFLSLLYRQNY